MGSSAIVFGSHEDSVRTMMEGFGQHLPTTPTIPDLKTARLRAMLQIEENLELCRALGLEMVVQADVPITVGDYRASFEVTKWGRVADGDYTFECHSEDPDLVEIADACADIAVVTRGTALACGIDLDPIIRIVDENNMLKIATGHKDPVTGKFIKSENHPAPTHDIVMEIARQQTEGAV